VTRTYSPEELSEETGVSIDRLQWLTSIGILKPPEPGRFSPGDAFRAKLIAALLAAGFRREQIEWGAADGTLDLGHLDHYLVVEPAPRSERTFAEFLASAGPRAGLLPGILKVLGLPEPDPSSRIGSDEEELLERFLEAWSLAGDDETLNRAARLMGDGTRLAAVGWTKLFEEQIARPAREPFFRGEVDRFPPEVVQVVTVMIRLMPRFMAWLTHRYVEQLIVAGIVEGFESVLAARGRAPFPEPAAPPAVVFADVSGYTRLTEAEGDEAAVRVAELLQKRAEAIAADRGGRLVKLLGDGAMLIFADARTGAEAALELVRTLNSELGIPAHAGVHAGPVIERDRDLFGRTVNLASRIAGAAGPGEVIVSEAVVRAVGADGLRFEGVGDAVLKGVPEPVSLFRARSLEERRT